jgi:hypothetical protein
MAIKLAKAMGAEVVVFFEVAERRGNQRPDHMCAPDPEVLLYIDVF